MWLAKRGSSLTTSGLDVCTTLGCDEIVMDVDNLGAIDWQGRPEACPFGKKKFLGTLALPPHHYQDTFITNSTLIFL